LILVALTLKEVGFKVIAESQGLRTGVKFAKFYLLGLVLYTSQIQELVVGIESLVM
jgi:hypothetical protein